MTEIVARLRIVLDGTDPIVWREVDVPVQAHLKMVHDVIQGAMGWFDYHLWEFEAGGRRYGVPDPDWGLDDVVAAKNVKLAALIDRGVRFLEYRYDMGDDWLHLVTIERIGPGEEDAGYPRYVGGVRRAPPEDIGGIPGFELFLEAIGDHRHPQHSALVEWHAGTYGCAFDPDNIDETAARQRIGEIAKRRAAGKAAYAKSRRA